MLLESVSRLGFTTSATASRSSSPRASREAPLKVSRKAWFCSLRQNRTQEICRSNWVVASLEASSATITSKRVQLFFTTRLRRQFNVSGQWL
jgi:hypothetical protein